MNKKCPHLNLLPFSFQCVPTVPSALQKGLSTFLFAPSFCFCFSLFVCCCLSFSSFYRGEGGTKGLVYLCDSVEGVNLPHPAKRRNLFQVKQDKVINALNLFQMIQHLVKWKIHFQQNYSTQHSRSIIFPLIFIYSLSYSVTVETIFYDHTKMSAVSLLESGE